MHSPGGAGGEHMLSPEDACKFLAANDWKKQIKGVDLKAVGVI